MDPYDPNIQPARKEGMGCFAKGCLTLVVVGFLLVCILGFFGYRVYHTISGYIADHPANVQVYPATDAQYKAVMEKITPFATAVEANRRETLELTGEDLNVLVAKDPNFADARGKASFAIARDEIIAEVSAPIDEDKVHDRPATHYFNGRVSVGLTVDDGELDVLPHDVTVNGKPLPAWAMQIVQNKDFKTNFIKSMNDGIRENAKARDFMNKLHSVRVVGDHLVLTSTGEPAVAPTPAP